MPSPRTHWFFLCITLVLTEAANAATPPLIFESRGAGGGGALFAPSYSPHATSELFISCDMGELFHTTNSGVTWTFPAYREIAGNRLSKVGFTDDPMLVYCLDSDHVSSGYWLSRSTDGGTTWARVPSEPTGGDAWALATDPADRMRILISSYDTVYMSTDGGATFQMRYSDSSAGLGVLIAGVGFDGSDIFAGTNRGLLMSTDGGATFAMNPTPGIAMGSTIASFAWARSGATRRFAVTTMSGSTYPGIAGDSFGDFTGVYTLDSGQPSWVSRTVGVVGGLPFFIGMASSDIDTIYLAGGGGGSGSDPAIWKSTSGGATWAQVLLTAGNQNIATGWSGAGGDRGWSYGELAFGFAVAPTDSARVAFTDFGFAHQTTDGGVSWQQLYVDPATQNPAGAPTPTGRAYRTSGIENTSSYSLIFCDANNLFAGFCDIRGLRSTDGGLSWGFNYTGHSENSMYGIVRHPSTGVIYAATSTIHDLYQSTRLTDSILDAGDGRVIQSVNLGATWTLVHDFGSPVFDVTLDPAMPTRLYATVTHSTLGGIFRSDNIDLGPSSTWIKLANPPRTQGHPVMVKVLSDGTLVATYSGRRAGSPLSFTASSGVFTSTDGGATWSDVSAPAMVYWTKDIVIAPNDPTQSTWLVGVWSGWGAAAPGFPSPGGQGGLYRTTNRGTTWTRIASVDRVTSCTFNPTDADDLYFTSEENGLWHSDDATSAMPVFAEVDSYRFRQPERVYFNPFDPTELWVTSFGNGLNVGTIGGSGAACGDCNGDGFVSILDALLAAQTSASLIVLVDPSYGRCNVQGTAGGTVVAGATVDILDALHIARFAAGSLGTLICAP